MKTKQRVPKPDEPIILLWISEEEMLFLAIECARFNGQKYGIENYGPAISRFYRQNLLRNDDRFEFRELGDGMGFHLFRPFHMAAYERDMIVERREKALKKLARKKSA